ncbi:MAG: hypothetical protein WA183_14435 [Chthoniobacterales bacterium]
MFHILEIYASFKTLRAAERVQFHRDEMERTWYEEVETLPDVAAATFASDFGEDLRVGQHQIHRERCGRIAAKRKRVKFLVR